MVTHGDGGAIRRRDVPTLSTVWFDCGHCKRKSIGTVRTGSSSSTIRCTHIDCEKESPWRSDPPARYRVDGGLTPRQRMGRRKTS